MTSISDEVTSLGPRGGLIQNLGPGNLFLGTSEEDTDQDGIKLLPGQALSVGFTIDNIYAVSDDTSDVRILPQGIGIFSVEATA